MNAGHDMSDAHAEGQFLGELSTLWRQYRDDRGLSPLWVLYIMEHEAMIIAMEELVRRSEDG